MSCLRYMDLVRQLCSIGKVCCIQLHNPSVMTSKRGHSEVDEPIDESDDVGDLSFLKSFDSSVVGVL